MNVAVGKKTYYVEMTTLQCVVLLALSALAEGVYATLDQVVEMTGVSHDMLKRILHSLACNKRTPIVLKKPPSQSIKDADVFAANRNFKSQLLRNKCPTPCLEDSETVKKVEESRTHAIDAAIVRVMKTRKVMLHNELESEVFRMLNVFQPSMRDIKRQIEALIEREYLERSADDKKKYMYVA